MGEGLVTGANRKWWTLGAVSFALFMIMLDNTIVNVALPSIGRGLEIGVSQLEWVVNAYTLAFAVLMLTGGRVADLYGRRLVFMSGLVLFTAASLACGLAPDATVLIAARTVQGAGAALMMPATLSIISAAFPREERGTAIGIWAGVSGTALAIGPLLGGLLTEHVGWSWIFFVNVPVGVVALVAARALIDESKSEHGSRSIDLAGLLTSATGLLALTYALIEANGEGWTSPQILVLFAVAAVCLTAFVLLERHREEAMLDLRLFGNSTFAGANTAALLVSLAMFGIFFFVSIYMQNILGYSAVRAGATFLPMTCLIIVSAPLAGRITDRIGPRWPIAVGMALLTVALYLFSRLGIHSGFRDMLPGMLVGGVGMGAAMGPMTAAALSTVSLDEAGVGAGVLTTFRQIGGALGIAIMGAIVAAAVDSPPSAPGYPLEFLTGFRHALLTGAAFTLAGAVIGATLISREDRAREPLAAAR